jgi:hypothetical protein
VTLTPINPKNKKPVGSQRGGVARPENNPPFPGYGKGGYGRREGYRSLSHPERNKAPIIKRFEPDFNEKAAKAAYDLVMKMDEDEARMFTSIVVADVTEEIIEKNLATVQRRVDQIVEKRLADLKRATISKAAGNPDAVPFAQAIALIEKAQKPWDESKYRRDQGGRFATKISRSQQKPINDRTASSMGIPTPKQKLTTAQKVQFQDEYRQLAAFLGAVHSSSQSPGDTDVFLHFRDKRTGQEYVDRASGTRAKASMLDPTSVDLVRVEARPNTINVGGAAFGLTQSLGEGGVRNVNALTNQGNVRQFSDDWMREDQYNSNIRTYSRIKAGSDYLSRVAPAGSKMQLATEFGSFVGNMGPEAERVIGPTARKTAYRYRGTEKAPDPSLVGSYGRAVHGAKMRSALEPTVGPGGRANLKRDTTKAPSQMAAIRVAAERRAPTFEERAAGRAEIQRYLMSKMPNRKLYELQLASGNTPPSQGVLLNSDGQIVSEAVGYGDDHYIPFDLKNLKALKGGEYIRTRSVGGLTSEDIYVGLMTGAKQVTVVSRSGTFTLTFADDFRGGRRHNDKARRMTRRYEQILDAVQSEQIDRGAVDPNIVDIIERDVETELGEFANYRDKRAEVKRRIEAYKADPELSPEDEKLIQAMSRAALRDGTTKDEKIYRRQITGQLLARKQTRYRLDGPGYEDALKALEEQFPYYITVSSNVTDVDEVTSYERDKGYVEPGRNRPTAARAGLFGTQVNQGQKFSASQADFQSGRAPARSNVATQPQEGSVTPAPERNDPDFVPKETVDTKKVGTNYASAATSISQVISDKIGGLSAEDQQTLQFAAEDFADPAKVARFDEMVSRAARSTDLGPALNTYNEAKGMYGLKPYEKMHRGIFSNVPFAFAGPAYEGKNLDAKRSELAKIDAKVPSSIYSGKKYSEMTESEMAREHSGLLKIYEVSQLAGDAVQRKNAFESVGAVPDTPGTKMLINDPKFAGKFIDQLHRAHAVKKGVSDEELYPPERKVVHMGNGEPDQGPRAGATRLVASLQAAADAVESSNPAEAREYRALAFELKEGLGDIKSKADVDAFLDSNRDTVGRAGNVLRKKNNDG